MYQALVPFIWPDAYQCAEADKHFTYFVHTCGELKWPLQQIDHGYVTAGYIGACVFVLASFFALGAWWSAREDVNEAIVSSVAPARFVCLCDILILTFSCRCRIWNVRCSRAQAGV